MGREMLVAYPEFKKTAMKCEQWLLRNGYPGCFEIFESLGGSVEPSATLYVQTATFVLQVSLARLLISIGITPTLLVGHRYVCKYRGDDLANSRLALGNMLHW